MQILWHCSAYLFTLRGDAGISQFGRAMKLLWIIAIMATLLSYFIYDKAETMLICWQADHMAIQLAPPVYHKTVKESQGRES